MQPYQKTQSSPSKMFRQFNAQCGGASKSPYRNIVDKSESSSIGPKTQSSYGGFNNGANVSPVHQQNKMGHNDKGIQNVHKRVREYQGSQSKTNVSKALFQGEQKAASPNRLQ